MGWKRSRTAVTVVAAAAAAATTLAAGFASGGPGHAIAPAGRGGPEMGLAARGPGLAWFRARPAPPGWRQATLPAGGGVLSFPPSLSAMPGDAGTVTRGLTRSGAVLVYLNVTPRQGDETLRGWARFRLEHLCDDDARSARLDSEAAGLAFRDGRGSCVIDDYLTRAGAHRYREIACYVQGAHASTVLVAATPAADWARYGRQLEQAVDSYVVS
jgi:hypothetical protein